MHPHLLPPTPQINGTWGPHTRLWGGGIYLGRGRIFHTPPPLLPPTPQINGAWGAHTRLLGGGINLLPPTPQINGAWGAHTRLLGGGIYLGRGRIFHTPPPLLPPTPQINGAWGAHTRLLGGGIYLGRGRIFHTPPPLLPPTPQINGTWGAPCPTLGRGPICPRPFFPRNSQLWSQPGRLVRLPMYSRGLFVLAHLLRSVLTSSMLVSVDSCCRLGS